MLAWLYIVNVFRKTPQKEGRTCNHHGWGWRSLTKGTYHSWEWHGKYILFNSSVQKKREIEENVKQPWPKNRWSLSAVPHLIAGMCVLWERKELWNNETKLTSWTLSNNTSFIMQMNFDFQSLLKSCKAKSVFLILWYNMKSVFYFINCPNCWIMWPFID